MIGPDNKPAAGEDNVAAIAVTRNRSRRRIIVGGSLLLALGVATIFVVGPVSGSSGLNTAFVQDSRAGFVVSEISYVLGPDAENNGTCPNGMSRNNAEIFAATQKGQRRPGEDDETYSRRMEQGGQQYATAPDGSNLCLNPELAPPDTHFRTMDALNVRINGIDLDGAVASGVPTGFARLDGSGGVDNQFARLVGCSRSFQSTGQSNSFRTEMYTGAWGILLRLEGLDDIRNDEDITLVISANADPIRLSPTRAALDYATYAMTTNPELRATTRARIRNGVLTSDPVDVQFVRTTNAMRLRRVLRAARIQAALSEDGKITGVLAGYTPVEALYNFQFGYRDAVDAQGRLSPRRGPSANGAARVLGYTCPGVYQAIHRLADGGLDPRTRRFTAISTQYRFEAIPAFVIDADAAGEGGNASIDAGNANVPAMPQPPANASGPRREAGNAS